MERIEETMEKPGSLKSKSQSACAIIVATSTKAQSPSSNRFFAMLCLACFLPIDNGCGCLDLPQKRVARGTRPSLYIAIMIVVARSRVVQLHRRREADESSTYVSIEPGLIQVADSNNGND